MLDKFASDLSKSFSQNRIVWLVLSFLICLGAWVYLAFALDKESAEQIFKLLPSALSGIVGIGITILITTFSFIFVALSLVSAQFSPRIIRHFWQGDNFRRLFLWSFIFIFAFCFIIQFFDFPKLQLLGIVIGFYLIFIMFPIFLGYLAENINVATITRHIAKITVAEIKESYQALPKIVESNNLIIRSKGKGYLEAIDTDKLIEIFSQLRNKNPEISMQIPNFIGSFIEEMSALAIISPNAEIDKTTADKIENCFRFNKFRSINQDVEYGIRQLVDIGIKAISAAVNDPTTCVNCLNYLGVIIKNLAIREEKSLKAKVLEKNKIFLREPSFEKYVDDAFNQIYQWGKSDYIIVKTIIHILTDIISVSPDEKRFNAILNEVNEMQLSYLYENNSTCFIQLHEHRKYVLKYLKNFYLTAMNQAEKLGLSETLIVINEKVTKIENFLDK